MRFDDYYFMEEEFSQSKIDWNQYVKDNEELKYALEIMKKIEDAGFESLIVGGFVRDLVMGNPSDDIDLTSNATPEEIEKIFGRVIDVGKNKEMGVSVVPYKGYQYEIAAYRQDSYDDLNKGKGADTVQLTKSFKDDAARRDLTINQLGIDRHGNIVDHHGGLKDLENKIVSTVGDPNLRFKEDQVRQLRSVRFASRFDFDIDHKTIAAMKKNAPEIAKVAPERITKELRKMAKGTGKQFARAIEILDEVGLLEIILPEVAKMKSMEHSPHHHPEKDKDGKHTVLAHVIEALKASDVKDDIVNLSVLFHDIGKNQQTYSKDEQGVIHYFGHAKESFELIDEIAARLKFDNKTKEALKFASLEHMNFHNFLDLSNSTVAKLMDSPYFEVLKSVALADVKARGDLFDKQEWDQIEDRILKLKERFKSRKAIESIRKIVNGNFVMSLRKDIKPGPKLGDVIKATVEFILNSDININTDMDKVKEFILNKEEVIMKSYKKYLIEALNESLEFDIDIDDVLDLLDAEVLDRMGYDEEGNNIIPTEVTVEYDYTPGDEGNLTGHPDDRYQSEPEIYEIHSAMLGDYDIISREFGKEFGVDVEKIKQRIEERIKKINKDLDVDVDDIVDKFSDNEMDY